MKDFGKVSYRPVGKCIYCHSTQNLTREHILPFGLSGTGVLPKSSCKECARITGEVELYVLRGPMRAVRVYLDLMSRSRHKNAPKKYPLTVVKSGKETIVELPPNEYPIILGFPVFSPPAFLAPNDYKDGISLTGQVTINYGKHPEDVLRDLGVETISITQTYHPAEFARMIAKVAYSYAAAQGAINLGEGIPPIVSSILGEKNEIGRWVGNLSTTLSKKEGLLHRLALISDDEKGLLIGEVQLFADSDTPSYQVILSKLQ